MGINHVREFVSERSFLVIAFVSIVIKLVIVFNVNLVNPDAIRYFNSARELFHGNLSGAFTHEKMLVYTFTLGLFQWILHDWVFSGLLLSLVFLTLTLFPLYLFTKEVFGRLAATWAVVVYCLTPAINELTANVAKDAPFLFFMMMALWLGRKAFVDSRPGYILLTFGCAILASLFRFEGIVFLCVYFLWLLFNAFSRPSVRKPIFRGLLLFMGIPGAGVVLLFCLYAIGGVSSHQLESGWLRFGEHYFQQDLLGNYHAIYGQLKSVERLFPGGQWTHDFFEIARYNMPIIYLLGLVQILIGAIFACYLVPLFFGLKSAKPADDGIKLLGWMVGAYLVMDYFFLVTRNFLAERYVLIIVVMLLPLIGHGFEYLRQRLSVARHRAVWTAVILVLFVGLPFYRTFAETRSEKKEIRLAGEWLKETGKAAPHKLIVSDERISFYAGLWRGEYEVFPDDSRKTIEETAGKGAFPMMILELSSQDVEKAPEFEGYKLIKDFRGKKKTVFIYELS